MLASSNSSGKVLFIQGGSKQGPRHWGDCLSSPHSEVKTETKEHLLLQSTTFFCSDASPSVAALFHFEITFLHSWQNGWKQSWKHWDSTAIFTNFLQTWDEERLIQIANIPDVGHHKEGNKVSDSTATSYRRNRCIVRAAGTCGRNKKKNPGLCFTSAHFTNYVNYCMDLKPDILSGYLEGKPQR